MSASRTITISLLHGTFARGSTWPVIEEEIRRQFSACDPSITYPPWSGWNTVRARLTAAGMLENHLLGLVRAKPDGDHFIVAHSHGGNIALLALRNPEVRAAVRGVICLSTPFLLCRPRLFPRNGRALYETAAFMGVMAFVLYIVSRTLAEWNMNNMFSVVGVATVALLCAIPLFVRWHSRALHFMQRVTPSPHGMPILVIRSPSDEASLFLATFQAVAALLSFLWSFISGGWLKLVFSTLLNLGGSGIVRRLLSTTVNILLYWSLAGLLYFVLVGVVWETNAFSASLSERIFVTPGLVLFAALNVPFFASAALFVPFIFLTALLLLPFGPGYSVYAPFIEVSVEQTPDVPCQSVPLPWSDEGTVYSDFLQHSRTHDDPRAASCAVDWMKQVLNSSSASNPSPRAQAAMAHPIDS